MSEFLDYQSELWSALSDLGQDIVTFDWDPEYFTGAAAGPCVVLKIGTRYLVLQVRPEQDWDTYLRKLLPGEFEVMEFISSTVQYEFANIDGMSFEIRDRNLISELPDVEAQVCKLVDELWFDLLEDRPTAKTSSLLKPSDIISVLAQGQGLRPEHPTGFVIDDQDQILVQDGIIAFGPINGAEKYYSIELEDILDGIGIEIRHQRMVMNLQSACKGGRCRNAEEFLLWHRESATYMQKRTVQSDIAKIELKIAETKKNLTILQRDLEKKRREVNDLSQTPRGH